MLPDLSRLLLQMDRASDAALEAKAIDAWVRLQAMAASWRCSDQQVSCMQRR